MSPSAPGTGLYAPDDTLWQVNRELLVVLAGSRALLLELAHPLVAAGVAEHSDFHRQPLLRLLRTLHMMQQLSFGRHESAHNASARVAACHHPVQGTLAEDSGMFPAGTPYDAGDPALRLWVFATLVDSILLTYDAFVRPMSFEEKITYYEDSKRMARRMGIPVAAMPHTFADFERYVREMLDGETLAVTPVAREVVESLFGQPVLGIGLRIASAPGIALMPERLREAYGFDWREEDVWWFGKLSAITRRLRSMLPDIMCVHPKAWLAERRSRRDTTLMQRSVF